MKYGAKLTVNDREIELSDFPQDFLTNVAIAAVKTLKGVDEIDTLELYGDSKNTAVVVNGKRLQMTMFPSEYITNTICGLISTLRGVDSIESVEIIIKSS